MPSQIESVQRSFQDQGLAVRAISIRDTPDQVMTWLKLHPISSRVLLDQRGTVSDMFRVTGTPSFVIVDRAGQLVGRGVGPREWAGDRGRALFRALLSGR